MKVWLKAGVIIFYVLGYCFLRKRMRRDIVKLFKAYMLFMIFLLSLLPEPFMLCIAGLLEVMDSLALLADTQGRELQSGLSDVSVKLKDKAIAIENRWNTFLNKNYEIRR